MKGRKLTVMALLLITLMGYQASSAAAQKTDPANLVTSDQIVPLQQDHALVEMSQKDAAKLVHRIPLVPIVVDGQYYEPEAITKYNGKALYFLVDSQAQKEGVLYAFTTIENLSAYMSETQGLPMAGGSISPNHTSDDPFSYFPEHSGYGGYWFALRVGYGVTNLGDWNDRASSVLATPYGRWTALYEHSDFGGAQLWIPASHNIYDLRPYGWNDRASSFGVWY